MAIEISEMTPEDCQQVAQLAEQVGALKLAQGTSIEPFVRRNSGLSLVARDEDDKIVAALLCGQVGDDGYVQQLAIAEDCSEQDIAKMLLDRAQRKLSSRGVGKCRLMLDDDTDVAGFWLDRRWPDKGKADSPPDDEAAHEPDAEAAHEPDAEAAHEPDAEATPEQGDDVDADATDQAA